MQIDIVEPFNSSAYEFVLIEIDVFSNYLFAAPLTKTSADTVARELLKLFFLISNFTNLASTFTNLASTFTDLASTFTTKIMHKSTTLLEIQIAGAVKILRGPPEWIL